MAPETPLGLRFTSHMHRMSHRESFFSHFPGRDYDGLIKRVFSALCIEKNGLRFDTQQLGLLTFSECQDLFHAYIPQEDWERWAFMMLPLTTTGREQRTEAVSVEISVIDVCEGCTDHLRKTHTTEYMPVVSVKKKLTSPHELHTRYHSGALITSSFPVHTPLFFPFIHL